jgi:hypothetical protein
MGWRDIPSQLHQIFFSAQCTIMKASCQRLIRFTARAEDFVRCINSLEPRFKSINQWKCLSWQIEMGNDQMPSASRRNQRRFSYAASVAVERPSEKISA